MSETAYTATCRSATVVLSALSLAVAALVTGPAVTPGHGAGAVRSALVVTVDGSAPCNSCGGGA